MNFVNFHGKRLEETWASLQGERLPPRFAAGDDQWNITFLDIE
jgi:hypothetical protein